MTFLNLESQESYADSLRDWCREALADFASPAEVGEAADDLNAYPGLEALLPPKTVRILEDEGPELPSLGRMAVLEGRVLWEFTAAGEGSRLKLGAKFLINPASLVSVLPAPEASAASAKGPLLPLDIGRRHLLQLSYEISGLARSTGLDPAAVFSRQRALIVASEDHMPTISQRAAHALSGIWPLENLWFMTQRSFHGLKPFPGRGWDYDRDSPRRLHNHGQMVMQKAMGGQVFRLGPGGQPRFMSLEEFLGELSFFRDLVSLNIEDMDYLTCALDLESLGLAIRLGEEGYGMAMEIMANNPERPIKGGALYFDPALGRDVMVESFRLKGVRPADIAFLNKNFNHYLKPAQIFSDIREKGLFMPVHVKSGHLYFQPVQGDINFWADTAFFARREARPINGLKSAEDVPFALEAMSRQDRQKGFREFVGLD
jgi:hypothetical protein